MCVCEYINLCEHDRTCVCMRVSGFKHKCTRQWAIHSLIIHRRAINCVLGLKVKFNVVFFFFKFPVLFRFS